MWFQELATPVVTLCWHAPQACTLYTQCSAGCDSINHHRGTFVYGQRACLGYTARQGLQPDSVQGLAGSGKLVCSCLQQPLQCENRRHAYQLGRWTLLCPQTDFLIDGKGHYSAAMLQYVLRLLLICCHCSKACITHLRTIKNNALNQSMSRCAISPISLNSQP